MSRDQTAMRPTRAKAFTLAFTLLEVLIVAAVIALLVTILIPSVSRARELARELARESAGQAGTEGEKLSAAREAAQEAAEELEIDDRVKALTAGYSFTTHYETTVFTDQPEGAEATDGSRTRDVKLSFKVEQNSDEISVDVVSVKIDDQEVYRSVQGEVLLYRGMGEWEDALDRVQWQQNEAVKKQERLEREAREYEFKAERERRFGPLVP